MAAFISGDTTISASTATKIVDAEDFDRRVILYDGTGGTRVAFTSAAVSTGARITSLGLSGQGSLAAEFVIPADEELWVYNTAAAAVQYLVTTAA